MARLRTGEMIAALVLIGVGALLLLGNLGLVRFDWGALWSGALIVFGGWLVWRAFQPPIAGIQPGAAYGIGEYQPDLTGKPIHGANFSHGFGDFDLDLTRASFADGENTVRASLGFGDLTVSVPRELAARVRVSAGFGEVALFGEHTTGIAPHLDFQSDDYATASRKLDLQVSIGFGEIDVKRET